MTNLDRMIEDALTDEDREVFASYGEQGVFAQTIGLFTGKMWWVSLVTAAAQLAMFGVAVYAGWKFLTLDDPMLIARWAALAWLAATGVLVIKTWFWMQMQTNRVLREVKRLELQVARTQAG